MPSAENAPRCPICDCVIPKNSPDIYQRATALVSAEAASVFQHDMGQHRKG
jgi:hypothetical protein